MAWVEQWQTRKFFSPVKMFLLIGGFKPPRKKSWTKASGSGGFFVGKVDMNFQTQIKHKRVMFRSFKWISLKSSKSIILNSHWCSCYTFLAFPFSVAQNMVNRIFRLIKSPKKNHLSVEEIPQFNQNNPAQGTETSDTLQVLGPRTMVNGDSMEILRLV